MQRKLAIHAATRRWLLCRHLRWDTTTTRASACGGFKRYDHAVILSLAVFAMLMMTALPSAFSGPPAEQSGPPRMPLCLVAFGDSTTAPRPGAIERVYSVRLQEALLAKGVSLKVFNAGKGGNTTRDARARFERDVLRHRPQIVVMQFGINDAAVDVWKTPPATAPRVSLADFEANLRAMVQAARQEGARVILMTTNQLRWTESLKKLYGKRPYEVASPDGFDAPLLAAYNQRVRALARELKTGLVDVRAAFHEFAEQPDRSLDDLLLDGMHPNDEGHEIVSRLLVPVVHDLAR